MSSRANPKVVVLMGGPSAERDVSLSSGRECAAALRDAECNVIEVDAGPDVAARLIDIAPDVVFNALHGRWGRMAPFRVCWNGFVFPIPIRAFLRPP